MSARQPRSGPPSRRWRDEERAQLLKLRASGMSREAIACRLGRTEGAVRHALNAMDAQRDADDDAPKRSVPTLWTSEEDDELCRLFAQGATYRQIAATMQNRSLPAIEARGEHLGLRRSSAGRPRDDEQRPTWTPPEQRLELWHLWNRANQRLRERRREAQEVAQ